MQTLCNDFAYDTELNTCAHLRLVCFSFTRMYVYSHSYKYICWSTLLSLTRHLLCLSATGGQKIFVLPFQ